MESDIIENNFFQENAQEKSFYVIHGMKDKAVAYDYFLKVQKSFPKLQTLIFENGDHYILLNEQTKIIKEIHNILNE